MIVFSFLSILWNWVARLWSWHCLPRDYFYRDLQCHILYKCTQHTKLVESIKEVESSQHVGPILDEFCCVRVYWLGLFKYQIHSWTVGYKFCRIIFRMDSLSQKFALFDENHFCVHHRKPQFASSVFLDVINGHVQGFDEILAIKERYNVKLLLTIIVCT